MIRQIQGIHWAHRWFKEKQLPQMFAKWYNILLNLQSYQGGRPAWIVLIMEALNKMPMARMVDKCDKTSVWVVY